MQVQSVVQSMECFFFLAYLLWRSVAVNKKRSKVKPRFRSVLQALSSEKNLKNRSSPKAIEIRRNWQRHHKEHSLKPLANFFFIPTSNGRWPGSWQTFQLDFLLAHFFRIKKSWAFFKTLFTKLQLRLKIFLEKGSSKLLERTLNFGPFWSPWPMTSQHQKWQKCIFHKNIYQYPNFCFLAFNATRHSTCTQTPTFWKMYTAPLIFIFCSVLGQSEMAHTIVLQTTLTAFSITKWFRQSEQKSTCE